MNQRGQVFSLDLMVGLVLVILAIGFLLSLSERSFGAQTAGLEADHLFAVASTASELLVTHPDITCDLMGGTTKLAELPNCVSSTITTAPPTPAQLGISSAYDFCLFVSPSTACTSGPPSTSTFVASVDRQVVVLSSTNTITKNDYYNCLNGSACPFTQQTLTIQVWRAS